MSNSAFGLFRNSLFVANVLAAFFLCNGIAILMLAFGPVVEDAGHYMQGNSYLQDALELVSWPLFVAGLLLIAISAGLIKRIELVRRVASLLLLVSLSACLIYGLYYAHDNRFLGSSAVAMFLGITIALSGWFGSLYLLMGSEYMRREFHDTAKGGNNVFHKPS